MNQGWSVDLTRISHTVAGVTEANVVTGKEKTAGRIGNTAKGFDAACRHKRPALRVARGGSPGASKPSTLEHDTTRLNHSDGAVLGQDQAKARMGVPGVRARAFAPDLAEKRPSLRAFDRRTPDAEPVSSDAPHRPFARFDDGSPRRSQSRIDAIWSYHALVPATLFGLLLPDRLRPGAMTLHEGGRSPG